MTEKNNRVDEALEAVDPSKRAFLRKVVVTTAFAAPVVASFAIDGMVVSKAIAQPTNSTVQ